MIYVLAEENGVRVFYFYLPLKQETTQINETHLCFEHFSSFKLKELMIRENVLYLLFHVVF